MMDVLKKLRRTIREAKMFSPAGFLTRAAMFWMLYLIFDLAGARAYVSFLSGTMPQGPFGDTTSRFLGVTYLLLHLLAYVLAPILAIAAALFWCVERQIMRRKTSEPSGGSL